MKITSESAILGIGLIILAYEVYLLKSKDAEILAVCKADINVIHAEINALREASTAAASSRNLETSPFTCTDNVCTAENKLFQFPKGVVIGKLNITCPYGTASLSVDLEGTNCPGGDNSVTFGKSNSVEATGSFSSITGGLNNEVKGSFSSITGGQDNKVTGKYSLVSGGWKNKVSGERSSILGGKKQTVKSAAKFYPTTKSSDSPFICESGWCTSVNKHFLFPEGIVIGMKDVKKCEYGTASLTVDLDGTNCASGDGAVAFGNHNIAKHDHTTVTGGKFNTASGQFSSISGGHNNFATGKYSSISGGMSNQAIGTLSSILGGAFNSTENENEIFPQEVIIPAPVPVPTPNNTHPFECKDGWCTSSEHHFLFPKGIVIGHKKPLCSHGDGILSVDSGRIGGGNITKGSNCPKGDGSVTFGSKNKASGRGSSILGGEDNSADGEGTSILGGEEKKLKIDFSTSWEA